MKFTHNNTTYELLVLTTAGSRLYGNSRPESDWDYRGVFLAPNSTKLGLEGTVEQLEGRDVFNALVAAGFKLEDTDDVCLYELNRFAKLALDNNPNILDTLCGNQSNAVYVSEKGKKLLDAKDLFLSKKSKFTFSGYAVAQLKRIKGHNKWINEFPETDKVLAVLVSYYEDLKMVDFTWMVENFGGQVAEKVTGMTQEEAQKVPQLTTKPTWHEFKLSVTDEFNWDKYRVPRLVDYMKAYDLRHSELDMTKEVYLDFVEDGHTMKEFLEKRASFRKFGESVLSVYTDGKGVFGKEGNLKSNDSEHLGEFVCLATVNHNQYKADKDHVNKMWHWKVNRNEKRGKDEEKFGIDLKHLSHLWRLMTKAKELLETGKYTPEFYGDDLEKLKSIRDGSLWGMNSYEKALEFAEQNDKDLDELYKTSTLRNKPDHKKVNALVTITKESLKFL